MPSISCSNLTYDHPDGTRVLEDVNLALGPGRAGLVGTNGAGKSTLLGLLSGRVRPTAGAVIVDGTVGLLPQHLTLETGRAVDDVLGIASQRRALRRIAAGDVTAAHLDAIGDAWDVEERGRAMLDRLGLPDVHLDRTVGGLSGGETTMLGLAALLLDPPDALLLDEPTNNLDARRRADLYGAVETFRGVLVVVSHDRALLERVDAVVELRDRVTRVFGGGWSAYEQAVAAEQEVAAARVRTARSDLRSARRELVETRTRSARRARVGRRAARGSMPRIVAGARKRQAQESAGRAEGVQADRVASAAHALEAATAAVRDDEAIRIDLARTSVPSRRVVVDCRAVVTSNVGADGVRRQLWSSPLALTIRGPERIALIGPNGVGKTTLLNVIAGTARADDGQVVIGVDGVAYLPQRLDVADDDATLLEHVRAVVPTAGENSLRARLAGLGFRGPRVTQPLATLSGGERFRAVLARLLLAEPPPQLLLLDEPTNNLDLHSTQQLELALAAYEGALLVASHDDVFLRRLGITRWLRLDRVGGLIDTAGPTADDETPVGLTGHW
jgi:ATPase subunit of ABC transporter with duplicated ATPase domains